MRFILLGQILDRATWDAIYAYYGKADSASAIAAADRYIQLYPQDDNVDYALYMKGVCDVFHKDKAGCREDLGRILL